MRFAFPVFVSRVAFGFLRFFLLISFLFVRFSCLFPFFPRLFFLALKNPRPHLMRRGQGAECSRGALSPSDLMWEGETIKIAFIPSARHSFFAVLSLFLSFFRCIPRRHTLFPFFLLFLFCEPLSISSPLVVLLPFFLAIRRETDLPWLRA